MTMDNSAQKKFQLVLKVLNLIGYYESSRLSKLCEAIYIILSIILILGHIIGIINRTTMSDQIEILYFFNIVIFHFVCYGWTKSQQKRIEQFLLNISSQTVDDLTDIRLDVFKLTVEKATIIVLSLLIFWAYSLSGTTISWFFLSTSRYIWLFWQEFLSHPIPFWMYGWWS